MSESEAGPSAPEPQPETPDQAQHAPDSGRFSYVRNLMGRIGRFRNQPPETRDAEDTVSDEPRISRRLVLRGLFAAGVATGIGSLGGDSPREEPAFVEQTRPVIPSPETYEGKLPYDPTPEEIEAVEALFDKPGRPPVDFNDRSRTISEIEAEHTKVSLDAAKKHGLTVYDWRTYSDALMEDAYQHKGEKYKVDIYLEKAKEFLDKYGIELTLGDNTEEYEEGDHPLDKSMLDTEAVKMSLVNLISEIGEIPVEVIKAMGLKKVKMIKIEHKMIDGKKSPAGYADVESGDTYYFDPTKHGGLVLPHEAYHLYDANHGDTVTMHRDKGFRALNPPEQIYKREIPPQREKNQYISDDGYIEFSQEHNEELYAAKEQGDTQTVERLQKELDAKAALVVAESDYGLTNVVEDKADIACNLLDSLLITSMLDRKKPILRKKALFLLARFYHDNPAFVKFYADISRRE